MTLDPLELSSIGLFSLMGSLGSLCVREKDKDGRERESFKKKVKI